MLVLVGVGLREVRNVCNRLGGFEPDLRQRSDDGSSSTPLVTSGRAVALLAALLPTAAMPQITARRLREERLQRTIFTATRTTTTNPPAVLAVRRVLRDTAEQVAARRRDLEVAC